MSLMHGTRQTIDECEAEIDRLEAENNRLSNAIAIAIGRMDRHEFGAARMGLKAARGDFADELGREGE